MIEKSNKKQIRNLAIIIGFITVLDILTIITNAYVSPYLDGYGLPDILIYLKTGIFAFVFVVLLIWLFNDNYQITKGTLKVIIYLSFATIIGYFLSVYMYKYLLLLDTADIIRNKILYGNPALVYNFSSVNYKTLSYIIQIFGGFNSELVLLAEVIAVQFFAFKIDQMPIKSEEAVVYDPFMFDKVLLWLSGLLTLLAFLSINIFQTKYDLYQSFEIAIALSAFAISIPGLITAIRINSVEDLTCTKSFFVSSHRLLTVISIINIILFLMLTGLTVADFVVTTGSYRIYSTVAALIVSLLILLRVRRTMSLENK